MSDKILSQYTDNADVLLLGIPYDKTSSFGKGADKGPEAILNCLDTQIELYERFTKWSPAKKLKIVSLLLPHITDKEPETMVKEVSSEIKKHFGKYKFIIALGGEHSISIGIFDALSKKLSDITILQIDAHLDLRDDDSDYNLNPSKFAHSCVMKRGLDMGLKLVSVGARAYADFELKTALQNNVAVFEWPREENQQWR
ncbi:arginase family protein [Candidatus Woesearchaeota archaeon]|nr:arginase family protein [Candidatus Woesearchaeota archaeon]